MSSHTRKLAETMRLINNMKQSLESTVGESEYHRGLYNGVEMMRSMLQGVEAKLYKRKTVTFIKDDGENKNEQ